MQALFVGMYSAMGQGIWRNMGHYIAICAIMGHTAPVKRFTCKA